MAAGRFFMPQRHRQLFTEARHLTFRSELSRTDCRFLVFKWLPFPMRHGSRRVSWWKRRESVYDCWLCFVLFFTMFCCCRLCLRMGEVVIELYWQHAPNTCRNFAELARRGYYDGTKFHRIIRDFMIQGGCFTYFHSVLGHWELMYWTFAVLLRWRSYCYGEGWSFHLWQDICRWNSWWSQAYWYTPVSGPPVIGSVIFCWSSLLHSLQVLGFCQWPILGQTRTGLSFS